MEIGRRGGFQPLGLRLVEDGHTLYASCGGGGLVVLSVATRGIDPPIVQTVRAPPYALDAVRSGDFVFIAGLRAGVLTYDVSDMAAPRFVGRADTNYAFHFALSANKRTLFLGDGTAGIKSLEAFDPSRQGAHIHGVCMRELIVTAEEETRSWAPKSLQRFLSAEPLYDGTALRPWVSYDSAQHHFRFHVEAFEFAVELQKRYALYSQRSDNSIIRLLTIDLHDMKDDTQQSSSLAMGGEQTLQINPVYDARQPTEEEEA